MKMNIWLTKVQEEQDLRSLRNNLNNNKQRQKINDLQAIKLWIILSKTRDQDVIDLLIVPMYFNLNIQLKSSLIEFMTILTKPT